MAWNNDDKAEFYNFVLEMIELKLEEKNPLYLTLVNSPQWQDKKFREGYFRALHSVFFFMKDLLVDPDDTKGE